MVLPVFIEQDILRDSDENMFILNLTCFYVGILLRSQTGSCQVVTFTHLPHRYSVSTVGY